MDHEDGALSQAEKSLIIEALSARIDQLTLWMERATSGDQEAYYRARVAHLQRILDRLRHTEDRAVYRLRLSGAQMRTSRDVRRIDEAVQQEPLPARSNWDAGGWTNTYLTQEDAERAAAVWGRAGLSVQRIGPDEAGPCTT